MEKIVDFLYTNWYNRVSLSNREWKMFNKELLIYIFNPNENPEYFEFKIFTMSSEFIAEARFNHIGNKVTIDGVLARKGFGDLLYDSLAMYADYKNSLLCTGFTGIVKQSLGQYKRMFNDDRFYKRFITLRELKEYVITPLEPFIILNYKNKTPLIYGYKMPFNKKFKKSIRFKLSDYEIKIYNKLNNDLNFYFGSASYLFSHCLEYGTSIIDQELPLNSSPF